MPFSLRAWVRSLAAPTLTIRKPRPGVRLQLDPLEARLVPAVVTVTTALDDLTPNDGTVSLREAIAAINADSNLGDPDLIAQNPGTFGTNDTIKFAIGTSGSVQTINVGSALPTLTKQAFIDGRSQGGANYAGPPLIVLNGNAAGVANGLEFATGSDGSTVRGLVIQQFTNGIAITGASGVAVVGNFIGTDIHGTVGVGIAIDAVFVATANNTIGGTSAGAGNLLSGAGTLGGGRGVNISGAGATGNLVVGNMIGTDVHGTAQIGDASGVIVQAGASNNTVGGTASGTRNLISGNGNKGLELFSARPATSSWATTSAPTSTARPSSATSATG